MHIGLDGSRAVTTKRTGTEAYAYNLIQQLLPLAVDRGHKVTLYFNQAPPANFLPDFSSVTYRTIPFPRLWTHLRLGWELRRHAPDIFFTPAHVIPITYGGASVATIHDLGYRHFPEAHPPRQRRYLQWSTQHNARVSRRVIADSEATKQDLQEMLHVPERKIDVIYPGIDPTLAPVTDQAQITAVLQKYGITAPYFLYLGTLQPRKNLVRLVEAYAQTQVPQQLVLAGQIGWLADPILVAINQLGMKERVHLTGFIEEGDKAALLSGATALLFPSLYEGFGFPVLEAQQCGTPVLTANSSSLPEVAGAAALLINPQDVNGLKEGIQQLATDPRLRAELVQKGLLNVTRFTWLETAVRVLNTLELAV